MANVLCVLYADPVDGYPPAYPRDEIPKIERYHGGQTTPTPKEIGFQARGAAGLRVRRARVEGVPRGGGPQPHGHLGQGRPRLGVRARGLRDADVVISQPFWPAYLTADRIAKAPSLKLAITAGIGSDHVDLQAAIERGITVAEVTYSNSISVSEHVVMMILSLVRNYIPSYQVVVDGGWNIADCASRSYDLEGMKVGTVGAGRIGSAVLRRLAPFEVSLHYTDQHRLPEADEAELGLTYHPTAAEMVEVCDVVTINAPLHPETEGMFDDAMLARMKRGSYLVNTARGKICDRDAIARALESGQLAGYAGDVWFPQPPPRDHPWRSMPHHGMTPACLGHEPFGAGALRSRHARDPRVLPRGPSDPRGVPDRRRRSPRGRGRPCVQRRRRDRWFGGGPALQRAIRALSGTGREAVAPPGSIECFPSVRRG